ncbi:hypothetical protein AF72_07135 [Xylella taiwanensis]|uniref:Uncharacterized protein n=1 Tax=Xylella taiwanensis TaxID=1444770 RepID=Z9JJW8_9GAMM|nr:hypothetical protein AF72_07135 [Xylella taiwanensis]
MGFFDWHRFQVHACRRCPVVRVAVFVVAWENHEVLGSTGQSLWLQCVMSDQGQQG